MPDSSRRNFLLTGLAVPAAASAARSSADEQKQAAPPRAAIASPQLRYRILGETGLKVTSVGFGCMVTSDASVIERAADIGITYFDTARVYQSGNNERMVGAALKGKRQSITLSSKSGAKTKEAALRGPGYQPARTRHRPSGHLVPARQDQARRSDRRPDRGAANR